MIQLLIISVSFSTIPTDIWPAFRGMGNSISNATQLPIKWSDQSNVVWTAELQGYGQSSPIVWHDRVFVTTIDGPNKEISIVTCHDLNSGRQLWRTDFESSQPAQRSNYISQAAPTPAVDTNQVYAFFETGNLAALTHDGKIVWSRSLSDDYGKFLGNHGLGSSVALTNQAIIVLVDHDGPSYLLAVEKTTGNTMWKTNRPSKVSWSSPIVDRAQVIVSSNGTCEAVATENGQQLWTVSGIEGNTVPSATVTTDMVFVGSSQTRENLAIRRGGEGELSPSHIVWRSQDATATFSSPLVYQGHVYMVNRAGVMFCLDETTGEKVWTRRLGDSCWVSPLGACDRVYFFGKSGKTTIVASGPDLKVLAENELAIKDRVYGVAAVEKKLIIRTGNRLICVADKDKEEARKKKETPPMPKTPQATLPDLPWAITSFGAALLDKKLYVFGGHHGKPHHYYDEGQSGDLLRLNLQESSKWENVVTGPKRQGLALVAYGGKLYQLGGFSARNQEDEEQDLWSVADFSRFDPETDQWEELPPMPVPRSSFDAVVVDNILYVAGGWALQGDKEPLWHDSLYAVDLSKPALRWIAPQKTPFSRRALSLGTQNSKIYAIGGMQPNGKVTVQTTIYDPQDHTWADGPELPGEEMEGFGTACCTSGGRLFVTTSSGTLFVISDDGNTWQIAGKLPSGRFFHQMLSVEDKRLIVLGGANMTTGKFSSLQWLNLP